VLGQLLIASIAKRLPSIGLSNCGGCNLIGATIAINITARFIVKNPALTVLIKVFNDCHFSPYCRPTRRQGGG